MKIILLKYVDKYSKCEYTANIGTHYEKNGGEKVCSRSALNNMLNGRKVMKICDVVKLKETLGVDANELYKSE